MGCDIHVWTERKRAGRWERVDVPDCAPLAWRNYQVFAFIGDVRNEPTNPWGLVAPSPFASRGLPSNMDVDQWQSVDHDEDRDGEDPDEWHPYDVDLHSPSWATLAELLSAEWPPPWFGRNNSINAWIPTVQAFADSSGIAYDDLRIVYAFDN